MEQAALHRMAESIAQLTLCQVTGEEIEKAISSRGGMMPVSGPCMDS
jgi:hypothetical protein